MGAPSLHLAREVIRLRLSQLLINEAYKSKKFRIPIHLALGHEALAVAVAHMMEDGDRLILSHRNLHYNLARQPSLKVIMDEFLLKDTGLGGGMQGSMNLTHPAAGNPYTSSILGNNLGVAAGVALALKTRGERQLTTVVTGDGAMEEGSFYETLVFLQSQSLAALVLVENNQWSLASRIEERRSPIDLATLAESLGAGYAALTGNDVYTYAQALGGLRADALERGGVTVVEVHLDTLGGHMADDDHFINYHAGPAPTTELVPWPPLAEDETDPLFVLSHQFGAGDIKAISEEMLGRLEGELS